MTPEERYARDVRRDAARRRDAMGVRCVVSRARFHEAGIGAQQLTVRTGRCLRVLQADVDAGLAVEADLGKFWFVEGYSLVGGDDVVPIG